MTTKARKAYVLVKQRKGVEVKPAIVSEDINKLIDVAEIENLSSNTTRLREGKFVLIEGGDAVLNIEETTII